MYKLEVRGKINGVTADFPQVFIVFIQPGLLREIPWWLMVFWTQHHHHISHTHTQTHNSTQLKTPKNSNKTINSIISTLSLLLCLLLFILKKAELAVKKISWLYLLSSHCNTDKNHQLPYIISSRHNVFLYVHFIHSRLNGECWVLSTVGLKWNPIKSL